ncbi:MAG TPA: GWxTD domain-containing protein [Flavobacteriales bacterium]|nr:GWxTD domain-containing protein [Flavobacteriales bacterium]
MRINLLILVFSFTTFSLSKAQTPVSVDIKQFYAPGTGNYIEIVSSIEPMSFNLKTAKDTGIYCRIQQLIILKAGERIVDYRKKNIKSPYYTDTTVAPFITIERMSAPAGEYTLEYECTDLLNTFAQPLKATFKIKLENREDKNMFSHIELIEKVSSTINAPQFAKSGYEVWPYVSTFYPEYIEKIAFYAELYFEKDAVTNQDKFLLNQYIEYYDNNEKLNDYAKMTKVTAKDVYPIISSFDIKNLATGSYNLVLELRNKQNELVATEKIYFQRLNQTEAISDKVLNETTIENTWVADIDNIDTLNMMVGCIKPIATNSESDMSDSQLKSGNVLSKKQFVYLFWKAKEPSNPELAWLQYKAEVKKAQVFFGTRIKRGYETERGRVFLKYGPPNQITDRPNEPSAYPYQIWQYYKVGKFNNKFFLFYMPDLVSNDYDVLNSNVPGEYRNPRWEAVLYSRNTQNPDIDFPNQNNGSHYGGNVNELLKNPR